MTLPAKKMECVICGFTYDEKLGLPEEGIPPGTAWEQVPVGWLCSECLAGKNGVRKIES
jgi:rubredoxin